MGYHWARETERTGRVFSISWNCRVELVRFAAESAKTTPETAVDVRN